MIYTNNVFITLYLNITNQCNLNCDYCYIHDKKNYEKVAPLGNLINAIDTVQPQQIVITGGEPLLHPKLIQALIRHYESTLSKHWDIILCTNLYYKELSKDQLDTIKMVDYIQTSYSIDRTRKAGSILEYIDHNSHIIKRDCKNIKAIDCIFTITPEQLSMIPSKEAYMLLDLKDIDDVSMESLSYDPRIDIDWQEYYDKVDNYMSICSDIIPYEKNGLYKKWERCLKENINPMNCNMCSIGCAKTYENGSILNRCNCLVHREERKDKFINKCIECNLYEYCKMDCERFGNYCGFPKKTFTEFLNKYKTEVMLNDS